MEAALDGRERLAEYRGRLRLDRVSDSGGSSTFVIEVLDDDGRVAETVSYLHEDFPLAVCHYERRIVESLGSEVFRIASQASEHIVFFDREAIAALLHDDFVQLDFRPIGYPDCDRAAFLDVLEAQSDVVRAWLTQEILAASPQVVALTGSFWTLSYGRWTPHTHAAFRESGSGGVQ